MNKFIMFMCLLMFLTVTSSQANHNGRRVYIVYMGALPSSEDYVTVIRHHLSMLRSVTGKSYTPGLIVNHYGRTLDGFAAWLTEEESKKLAAMSDVVSVFPDEELTLHTTTMDGVTDPGLRTQHLAPL